MKFGGKISAGAATVMETLKQCNPKLEYHSDRFATYHHLIESLLMTLLLLIVMLESVELCSGIHAVDT